MRVVLALDKFKGTLSAQAASSLLAEGIRRRNPKIETQIRPMADGGEGTASILSSALGMESLRVKVPNLLGHEVDTHVYWSQSRRIAYIESASVLGVEQTLADEGTLMRSSTLGLGKLLLKALDLRPNELWLGVGGTLTADGGWGLAAALGLRAFDSQGVELVPCLENMDRVAQLDFKPPHEALARTSIVALCDVNAPAEPIGQVSLANFLEQKGAKPGTQAAIVNRIRNFWKMLQTVQTCILPFDSSYTGAGGGICIGLSSMTNNLKLELGAQRLARITALEASASGANLVLCGEGCLDEQTLYGKASSVVAAAAHQANVPVAGVFGKIVGNSADFKKRLGLSDMHVINPEEHKSAAELTKFSKQRLVEIGLQIAHQLEAKD